jgi:hypothetical protein
LINDAVCAYVTAMAVDDALGQGKSDAGASEIFHSVQSLEHAKEFPNIGHFESDAVVTYLIYGLVSVAGSRYFYHGRVAMAGVFDGIVQQIGKRLTDQGSIPPSRRQILHMPLHVPTF